MLLGSPGLTTRNKNATRSKGCCEVTDVRDLALAHVEHPEWEGAWTQAQQSRVLFI